MGWSAGGRDDRRCDKGLRPRPETSFSPWGSADGRHRRRRMFHGPRPWRVGSAATARPIPPRLDLRRQRDGRPVTRGTLRGHADPNITHLLDSQSDPLAENSRELGHAGRSAPQQRPAMRHPVETTGEPESDASRHRLDPCEFPVLRGEKQAAEVVGENPARRPRRQQHVAILHLQVPDASRMRHHSTPLYEAQHRGAPAHRQALCSTSETLDPWNAADYTALLDVRNSTKRLRIHYDHDVFVEARWPARFVPSSMFSQGVMSDSVLRQLSWLESNCRVLAQVRHPRVPLRERIKFLAILSANIDEFFTVHGVELASRTGTDSEPSRDRV